MLILADGRRIARYREEGIYLNAQRCDFNYTDAASVAEPVDLLLFAVKFGGLPAAIETCRHLVGEQTILLSVLNGITSEQILADAFGTEKVVWCTAQKMSAVKEGNQVFCQMPGDLALGVPAGADDTRLRRLTALLDSIGFPYTLPEDIRIQMWSKLLCNTGCNQAAMRCKEDSPYRWGTAGAERNSGHLPGSAGHSRAEGTVSDHQRGFAAGAGGSAASMRCGPAEHQHRHAEA